MKRLLLALCMLSSVVMASPSVDYDNGVYHVVLNGKDAASKMDFVTAEELTTNAAIHLQSRALLTVNTGFFDPKNGKTISYINSKWGESTAIKSHCFINTIRLH